MTRLYIGELFGAQIPVLASLAQLEHIFVVLLSETLMHMQLVCHFAAEQLQYLIYLNLLGSSQVFLHDIMSIPSLKPTTLSSSDRIGLDFFPVYMVHPSLATISMVLSILIY